MLTLTTELRSLGSTDPAGGRRGPPLPAAVVSQALCPGEKGEAFLSKHTLPNHFF